MKDEEIVSRILNDTKSGKLTALEAGNKVFINDLTMRLLNKNPLNDVEKQMVFDIITISNILYTNYSSDILVLEDGVYDLLMNKCKSCCSHYPVGAAPVKFDNANSYTQNSNMQDYSYPMVVLTEKEAENCLFKNDIIPPILQYIDERYFYQQNTDMYTADSHRNLNTKHGYPSLVGTLDKCKFVMNSQAKELGVFNDDNVEVFERDFLGKHLQQGIISQNSTIELVASLKYDGVSVEADIVGDMLVGARSRGDTENDQAMDVTPILYGYKFPYASGVPELKSLKFGMKFEAIMTRENLQIYNQRREYNYKNCRTAIISIFSSTDGYMFRNLITLVPIATSLSDDMSRIDEINFMNKYYKSPELFRFAIIRGDYVQTLFQVKRFTEEAELMRKIVPFMYDGVVIEYTDPKMREILGRKNSVNQWQIAIKFNPLKRQSIFRGYKFTVGQDGSITPMIYYDPVEFYGTIHTKSSGHSYDRFKTLSLKIGDIVDIEYAHDVMPYVTKPDNSHNASNPNPVFPFPDHCPSCGTALVFSQSGKSAKCPNFYCPERSLNRVVAMMAKLGLKGFAEESMSAISVKNLSELSQLTYDQARVLGEVNGQKILDRIYKLMNDPIYDYKIVGSLGFNGIAEGKWKIIFNNYSINDIMSMNPDALRFNLSNIKGIGDETVNTIVEQMPYFKDDMNFIQNMKNVISTKGLKPLQIRWTGIRDMNLMEKLELLGCDARDTSVTKDTNILIVPNMNYQSGKVSTAVKYGVKIMPYNEVKQKVDAGISLL